MNKRWLVFFILLFPLFLNADINYQIKKGDTLWGISKRFYKNPFKWPVIWKYNTYITNPDLIYPKNFVKIPGIKKGKPSEMEINLQGFERLKQTDSFDALDMIPLKENEDSYKALGLVEKKEEKKQNAEILTEIIRALNFYKDRHFDVVYDAPLDSQIEYISDDKYNASVGDYVYVKSKMGFKPGDKVTFLSLIRSEGSLDIYANIGDGEVIGQKNGVYQVVVKNMYDAVKSGVKVVRFIENKFPLPNDVVETDKDKKGNVISLADDMTSTGRGYRIVVDLGLDDGIKPGDIFKIYRNVEESGFVNVINVGEGTVIFSQDRFSSLYIINSTQEIQKGDYVKLKMVAVQ
jgi:hypothetical protein